jgi:hypothetical protein
MPCRISRTLPVSAFRIAALIAALSIAACAVPASGSDPGGDLALGIRQLEEGDYDAAIVTLDVVARRLAAVPDRRNALADAYIHLGIAFLGKGHEAAARSKFREALQQIRDLTLSPERFPPKVIDAFEAARAESGERATPPPGGPPGPSSKAKGGVGKKVVLAVLGLGAAGGTAVALAGGGAAAPGPVASPSSLPPAQGRVEKYSGNLAAHENLSFPTQVTSGGTLDVLLTWSSPDAVLAMDLHAPGSIVATSTRTGPTSARLQAAVVPQGYTVQILHRGSCATCATAFELRLQHP